MAFATDDLLYLPNVHLWGRFCVDFPGRMLALHVRPIALLAGKLDVTAIAAEIPLAGVLAQMLTQ